MDASSREFVDAPEGKPAGGDSGSMGGMAGMGYGWILVMVLSQLFSCSSNLVLLHHSFRSP